jgi:hypothetical protein
MARHEVSARAYAAERVDQLDPVLRIVARGAHRFASVSDYGRSVVRNCGAAQAFLRWKTIW